MNRVPQLTEAVRSWVDVPFLHQGRTRDGVDCAGLLVVGMIQAGVLPRGFCDVRDYGRNPQQALLNIVQTWCDQIPSATPGCFVLIRWLPAAIPSHVAYFDGENLIHAHARSNPRRVVMHRYGEPWLRRTHSFWKLRNV